MRTQHFFSISFLVVSALFFVGCTALSPSTSTTTSVVNENTNTADIVDSSVNVVAENTNTLVDSNWQTYRNTRYTTGEISKAIAPYFTMQYPKDLVVSEDIGGPIFHTPSITSGSIPNKADEFSMIISLVYGSPTTAEECFSYIQEQSRLSFFNIKELTWGNIKAIFFQGQIADREDSMYCLEKDGQVLYIGTSNLQPNFVELFDRMLYTISIE